MADKGEAVAKGADAGDAVAAGTETKAKRKIKVPALPQVPMGMIVLVAVPFLVFVGVFLYAMGYFPGKPVVFNVSVVKPDGTPADTSAAHTGAAAAGAGEHAVQADSSAATEQHLPAVEGPEGLSQIGATSQAGADTSYGLEQMARDLGLGDSLAGAPVILSEAEKTKRIKQMAKVYEQMPAASVASIVDNLPEDEAVKILAVMTPRSAAKVMSALGPEKAAVMSLMLTGFER